MAVNDRSHRQAPANGGGSAVPAPARRIPAQRRTQAERRRRTRQALLQAALVRMEEGESFDALSLRGLTRDAGIVPTAFYRHFANMEELGLALVEESFSTLREMLRHAREEPVAHDANRRSVEILIEYVRGHRQHFAFVARARSTGSPVLTRAVRNGIRLFTSELAADLAGFPGFKDWSERDLLMISDLLVNVIIGTIEAMLDVPEGDVEAESEIARRTEDQMRLTILGVPHWRTKR